MSKLFAPYLLCRTRKSLSVLVLTALVLACMPVGAQDADSPVADDDSEIPGDAFDRGTPFRSAEGFLATAGMGDYETAAEYLDLRNLRGEANELTGAQLARRFIVIIQRGDWGHISVLCRSCVFIIYSVPVLAKP